MCLQSFLQSGKLQQCWPFSSSFLKSGSFQAFIHFGGGGNLLLIKPRLCAALKEFPTSFKHLVDDLNMGLFNVLVGTCAWYTMWNSGFWNINKLVCVWVCLLKIQFKIDILPFPSLSLAPKEVTEQETKQTKQVLHTTAASRCLTFKFAVCNQMSWSL